MKHEVIETPPIFDGDRGAFRANTYDEATGTIDIVWTTGEKVRRYSWREGAYDEELIVAPGSIRTERLNKGAPLLNTHSDYDLSDVIGVVVDGSVRIENGRGMAKVRLSTAPSDADIVQKIREGFIRNISVGYRYHRVEKIEGAEGDVPVWRVVDWEPYEVSAVPVPADAGAQFRSSKGGSKEQPELALNPCIIVRSGAGPADEAITKGDDAMKTGDKSSDTATGGTDKAEVRDAPRVDEAAIRAAAITAERERIETIRKLGETGKARELADAAIRDGVSVEKFRDQLFDEMLRKQAEETGNGGANDENRPRARVGDDDRKSKRALAIADALLHRYDMNRYPLSDGAREFRGMSLVEIARDCLEVEGISTRGMARNKIAELALAGAQRSGGMHSTSDFPFILANIANKTLRASYEQAPQTFRPLVRVTSVPDFKAVSRTQLGEAPTFDRTNEHGEFRRGTMGEAREQYAIATYGKIVAVTRQVIINDDLDAFTRIPTAFGAQAANLESDLVWAQIVGNPLMGDGFALFATQHANDATTVAGLSIDSLGAGREAMRLQRGVDGRTLLNLIPRYLIVPVAAETRAAQMLAPTAPVQNGQVMPEFSRSLVPISEPRLDGGFINPVTGATVTGSRFFWYLAADPSQIDTVELAYLEGNQGVYTETRTGFDVDGVEVKVRLDAGAKVIDWRGLYRNQATGL